jgi:plastocyanin
LRRTAIILLILTTVVFVSCTKRRTPPTAVAPTTTGTTLVRMVGLSFVPHDTTVARGDTLLWVDVSGTHTTTSGPCSPCAADGLWDSGVMAAGDSFRVVFGPGVDLPGSIMHVDSTGLFPYYCVVHEFIPMDGSILVTP